MAKKKGTQPVEATLDKQALNVQLPADLIAKLKALAKKNKRKITAEVEIALEKHVASNRPNN